MVFGQSDDLDAIEAVRDGRLTATWDPYATGLAMIKAMETAMKAPGITLEYLIVISMFIAYENVGDWKDGMGHGVTYAAIPPTG